jgi:carboxylesterase
MTMTLNSQDESQNPKYFSGFDEIDPKYKGILWEQGLPFYLKSEVKSNTNSIVVCFHGFGASTYETRPIAEECLKLGIDAVAPLLPAHGYANIEDQRIQFVKMTFDGIMNAARLEVKKAREKYKKVFAYGQSMGGAIALALASEGLVDGLGLTAPAIKLPKGAGFAGVVLGRFNININKTRLVKERKFVNYSYSIYNLKAARQLQKISLYARGRLSKITCPVLECHSHNDSQIDPIVATWIQERVKGPVQVKWFDESDHTMPLDVKGKEVSETIAKFLKQIADK